MREPTTIVLILALTFVAMANGDLVARWDFDESSGQTVFDGSPNGLHGFLGSSTGVDPFDPTRIGGLDGSPGALQIGGNSAAQVPHSSLLQPSGSITVSALVRPSVGFQRGRVVMNLQQLGDNLFSGYSLDIQGDNLRFQIFSGSAEMNAVMAAFDFQPDVVYEIAGSWNQDLGIMDVFVNGASLADSIIEGSRITTITQIGANSGNLFIGSSSFGLGDFFEGDIDRVIVDNTPIPAPGAVALGLIGISAVCSLKRRVT